MRCTVLTAMVWSVTRRDTIASGASSTGHFWDLSETLLSKINDREHESYAQSMSSNPMIAKYRGVNVLTDSS